MEGWTTLAGGEPLKRRTSYNSTRLPRVPATVVTEVFVLKDRRCLYSGFRCHDPEPEKIVAFQTKRDGRMGRDDRVEIFLDTFNDRRRLFKLNAIGIKTDVKWDNRDWNEAWEVTVSKTNWGWEAEIAIPYRILSPQAEAAPLCDERLKVRGPRCQGWKNGAGHRLLPLPHFEDCPHPFPRLQAKLRRSTKVSTFHTPKGASLRRGPSSSRGKGIGLPLFYQDPFLQDRKERPPHKPCKGLERTAFHLGFGYWICEKFHRRTRWGRLLPRHPSQPLLAESRPSHKLLSHKPRL